MNAPLFETISEILSTQFGVDPQIVRPDTTLEQLGLDSLALMEFVFAVEDRFSVRVPEAQLDPRQAGITLAHIADVLDAQILAAAAGVEAA